MRKPHAPSSEPPARPAAFRLGLFAALSLALLGGGVGAQECRLPSGPLPSEARTVFLLDTSAAPQAPADSFEAVKAAVARALASQQLPGRVELVGYDQGAHTIEDFRWPQDRAGLDAALAALKEGGAQAWPSRSLEKVLSGLRHRPESATTVYLLAHAADSDPQAGSSLARALSAFEAKRGPFDRLYYLALGSPIPPAARAALAKSGYASGLELPAGQVPDLSAAGPTLPALIEVGPGVTPLAAGQYQLDARAADAAGARLTLDGPRLSLSGAASLPENSTALLCRQDAGGTQRALLRLRAGADVAAAPRPSAGGSQNPAPGLALLTDVGGELRLRPGGSLDLSYQLGGPATQGATLSFPDLPAGVTALLNGQDAAQGLSLHGGERATLTLREAGAVGGAPSLTVVPYVNGQSADSASALVLLGEAQAADAAGSPSLKLLTPGASGTLSPGQSVTWRYRVDGGPATIQALRSPPGTRASLSGARIGTPIPAGGEFAVSIVNDHLEGAGGTPQVQLTSGRSYDLPAVQPARRGGGLGWWWLLVLLALGGALAYALTRRRPARPQAAQAFSPRALSVEEGQLVLHGEGGSRQVTALGTEPLDVGAALNLPDLDGLKLERDGAGTRLVGLPPGLRLTERGRTLAVGDTLSPHLVYAFASGVAASGYLAGAHTVAPPQVRPVPPGPRPSPAAEAPAAPPPLVDDHFSPAEPPAPQPQETAPLEPQEAASVLVVSPLPTPIAETPAPAVPVEEAAEPAPAAQGTDFGQLSQDIASLGILGGVGGLGVPREMHLDGEQLVLRGDEGEEPQELPEGHTDLGEAFNIPAMQGLAVEREGEVVRLSGLPHGFRLWVDEVPLGTGAVLPLGTLRLEVPPSLRATVDRVREALGQEVDTRDAGIDLSDIENAINLDRLFGDVEEGGTKH